MTEQHEMPPGPGRRFLVAMERMVRIWAWSLIAAAVLTIFGVFPTAISVVAHLGPLWLVIGALIFWGRMLDEVMRPRSDMEDDPR